MWWILLAAHATHAADPPEPVTWDHSAFVTLTPDMTEKDLPWIQLDREDLVRWADAPGGEPIWMTGMDAPTEPVWFFNRKGEPNLRGRDAAALAVVAPGQAVFRVAGREIGETRWPPPGASLDVVWGWGERGKACSHQGVWALTGSQLAGFLVFTWSAGRTTDRPTTDLVLLRDVVDLSSLGIESLSGWSVQPMTHEYKPGRRFSLLSPVLVLLPPEGSGLPALALRQLLQYNEPPIGDETVEIQVAGLLLE